MRVNEIILENTELEEGWKDKLGAAALATGSALGGGYKYYQDREPAQDHSTMVGQEVTKLQQRYPEQDNIEKILTNKTKMPRNEIGPFTQKLRQISNSLQVNPLDLLKVMSFETKQTIDPSITNRIGATGLIQFMPKTAEYIGTTTDKLRGMSAVEQLDWVLRYYKIKKLPPGSKASDIYLSTFMPAVVTHNKPDDFVLGARKQYNVPIFKSISAKTLNRGSVWDQNPAFRELPEVAKRGYFTVGDVRKKFDSRSDTIQ